MEMGLGEGESLDVVFLLYECIPARTSRLLPSGYCVLFPEH